MNKEETRSHSDKYLIKANLGKNNFDIIRFILAVAVIFSHGYVIYYARLVDAEPGMIFTQNQVDIGDIAVDFFFIISGFLILRSLYNSGSIAEYLKRRVLRIYPGFLVAFFLSTLVIAPLCISYDNAIPNLKAYFTSINKKWFIIDLLTLQSPHIDKSFRQVPLAGMVNESLWTIQYEWICYLSLPLLSVLGLLKRRYMIVVMFLAVYLIFCIQSIESSFFTEKQFPPLLVRLMNPIYLPKLTTFFFAGACFYSYADKIKRSAWLAVLSFAAVILSCVWLKALNMVLPLAGPYLLFYFVFHPGIDFSNFAKNGDFSYGMYLYAWPVQQAAMHFFSPYINVYGLFFIAGAFSFVLSFLSWHYVEKVFLGFKNRSFRLSLW